MRIEQAPFLFGPEENPQPPLYICSAAGKSFREICGILLSETPHGSSAASGHGENAAKLNGMNTNLQLNLFNISIPQFGDWGFRTGLICDRLWRAISDGAPFDPVDHRLQELEWAYLFASCGMTWAEEYPGGKLFRVSYDLPQGTTRFIVSATPTSDGEAVVYSLYTSPSCQLPRWGHRLSLARINRRHHPRELSLVGS